MAELTGRHVFAITTVAFAVIIGVNVVLAVKAVSTFPGLEVENSYVAGQDFNERKAAQDALGWVMTPTYTSGRIEISFTDSSGNPVVVQDLKVLVGRTTEAKDDVRPEFTPEGGIYAANVPLGHGKWMLHVTAAAADGTVFEQRSDLFVQG